MRRGEIWTVDFEPAQGSEANKLRPAVIVSNNGANMAATQLRRGLVTVAPLTSNVDRVLPFQVLVGPAGVTGLSRPSKVQVEQLRAVSFQRIGHRVGYLPGPVLKQIDDALRQHLRL
jgi:mRNA interferase MazF